MEAARRRLLNSSTVEPLLAALAATFATLTIAVFGERRLGLTGLLLPLALVVVVILIRRPVAAVSTAIALAILCEGRTFGVPFTAKLYQEAFQGLTPLDGLVGLALLAVALDLIRTRRPLRLPGTLVLPLLLLTLAMTAGVIVTRADGGGLLDSVLSLNVLGYLLVLPIAIVNLDLDARRLRLLLGGAYALAVLKAIFGLLAMAAGTSVALDASTTITYYEPTANWVIMVALLGLVTAIVAGMRPPLWMLLGALLLVASDVLSYRRSFWIATVLGLLLVILLATSARSWLVIAPATLLIALAIWISGALEFQAQTPLARRVQSINPSQIERNAEDRYRIDERVNVVGEIGRHPISGIGLTAGWRATERALPVEHLDGRRYVHFAFLWWWLKLGILGAAAFVSILLTMMLLAWRVWRRNATPIFRCFGLAMLCGVAGLLVAETTASFTGVDPRFTIVVGAQLGLLAVLAQLRTAEPG